MSKKILLIDDEKNVHYSFRRVFEDLEIVSAYSVQEALELLSPGHSFSLIISDIKMEGISGLEFLEILKEKKNTIPVIIITAHGTLENAIQAIQKGAYEYLIKPFDFQKLKTVVYSALHMEENKNEKEEEISPNIAQGVLVGVSPIMQEIYKEIAKVSVKDVTVLVTGESGSGKELVARAIHLYSKRKDKPFIAVNCGAIPSELIESELFGYEKGAFTGANKKTQGRFQQAEGGTLFLDEIGELPLHLQVKLLRAIQDMEITPLGSEQSVKVNVRIIAATNRDLKQAIADGTFREDLYYRLNVLRIHLPPLRERKEDIPVLCQHFIQSINKRHNMKIKGISEEAMEKLLSYDFPGNVRELENIITRAAVHCKTSMIEKDEIELESSEEFFITQMEKNMESFLSVLFDKGIKIDVFTEKSVLNTVLKKMDYNQSKAAEYLSINRNTLRKKLKDHNLF